MLYAQFHQKSAIGPELVEACGDRAVIILDDRYANATNGTISRKECEKRGYLAYTIRRGDSFTRSHLVSGPWYVTNQGKVDNSAMSATWGA